MAAQTGDTVKVHYTGTLNDGTVFDSSDRRDPIEFTLGEGAVLPRFEAAVLGMSPGEVKTFTIPADEAYGPHHADRLLKVPIDQVPPYIKPIAGQTLEIRRPGGQMIPVRILEVSETEIVLDANHPLAGQDLTFET